MYTIDLNKEVRPVVNPPRKVPVVQRDIVKQELDRMVGGEVIVPVIGPTPWVSNMVIVPKKNGKIRICLDGRSKYGNQKISLSTTHY